MRSSNLTFGGYLAGITPVLSARSSLLCCAGVISSVQVSCGSLVTFSATSNLILLKHIEIILIQYSFVYMEAILYFGSSLMVYRKSLSFDFHKCKYAPLHIFPLNLHAPYNPRYGFYFFYLIGFYFIGFFNLSKLDFCTCYFNFTIWLC